MSTKDIVQNILKTADIEVGGSAQVDICITDDRTYDRIMADGTLGAGEAYMDGWWDAVSLDETIAKAVRCNLVKKFFHISTKNKFSLFLYTLSAKLQNRQNKQRAYVVADKHYNIGNELYTKMLDPWMQYSCGYWEKGAINLNEAQEAKLHLIAKKLKLEPGMRVLDIGCGWGGLSKFLAQNYDVEVTGITVSTEQAKYAREWVENDSVDIHVVDYREFQAEPFDRIVSVGMFEHVGHKNYRTYIEHSARLLKDNGLFLLHTIGQNETKVITEPWIDKYIFPNGLIPSSVQLTESLEDVFIIEDWHNFGASYDKTLMAWYENFNTAWSELSQLDKYDDRFYRMWEYYLLSSAGSFRARKIQLWQLILSKNGCLGGYKSVR